MTQIEPFEFKRTRGIIWVCDIEKSSSFLNDPELVDDIEAFLPRFYYLSKVLVKTFGGKFIKWTGDGFLAFFEVELERELKRIANDVFEAAVHLSFTTSISQMGLQPKKKIWIKHGITFEKDALLMSIQSEGEKDKLDIIGRSVVLAFRLSGIQSDFPSIVSVSDIIEKDDKNYVEWKPSHEDLLRYFKGEEYGTTNLRIYKKRKANNEEFKAELNEFGKKITTRIKKMRSGEDPRLIQKFFENLDKGPNWCKQISTSQKEAFEPIVKAFNDLISSFKKTKN